MIEGQNLDIVPYYGEIWSPGIVKNRLLLQEAMLKSSIKPCIMEFLSLFG